MMVVDARPDLVGFALLGFVVGVAFHHGAIFPRYTDWYETRCRECGYILKGITEPRCPECGERI